MISLEITGASWVPPPTGMILKLPDKPELVLRHRKGWSRQKLLHLNVYFLIGISISVPPKIQELGPT